MNNLARYWHTKYLFVVLLKAKRRKVSKVRENNLCFYQKEINRRFTTEPEVLGTFASVAIGFMILKPWVSSEIAL